MKFNPYLAIILAATIGGSSGVFIKLIDLPATTITFFRMAVPVIILLGYLHYKQVKLFRGNYRVMMLASVLNAVRMFLFFVGYLYASIGNAVIILFTWPIFGTLFSAIFLKEKVSVRTSILIGLAFTGIVIMYVNTEISFENEDFIGMAAMLFSAVFFAATAVIFKRKLMFYSRTETIFYQNLVGAVAFLPFVFINTPLPSAVQAGAASFYGILIGIVAFMMFFYALRRLKMSHYGLFTYWEVIAALFFGVLFFGEAITWNMVLGGGLILATGILLRKKKVEGGA
ncbi:MAG: DMT family transporter [Bacteroidales bacterium]|nr:DMT family transporter [Bacteroidales bacterium]